MSGFRSLFARPNPCQVWVSHCSRWLQGLLPPSRGALREACVGLASCPRSMWGKQLGGLQSYQNMLCGKEGWWSREGCSLICTLRSGASCLTPWWPFRETWMWVWVLAGWSRESQCKTALTSTDQTVHWNTGVIGRFMLGYLHVCFLCFLLQC